MGLKLVQSPDQLSGNAFQQAAFSEYETTSLLSDSMLWRWRVGQFAALISKSKAEICSKQLCTMWWQILRYFYIIDRKRHVVFSQNRNNCFHNWNPTARQTKQWHLSLAHINQHRSPATFLRQAIVIPYICTNQNKPATVLSCLLHWFYINSPWNVQNVRIHISTRPAGKKINK